MDVYGLWRVDGTTAWRVTLSNLDPRYYNTGSAYTGNGVTENSSTQNRSWTNVQILLEKNYDATRWCVVRPHVQQPCLGA